MKRILTLAALVLLSVAAFGQNKKVQKANYDLAERFSAKKVGQMVYSTQIRPNWFRDSDRFWYSWRTAEGTRYYLVDAATGARKEIFDMEKLARQITEITRDPYDAQHLPLQGLQLKDLHLILPLLQLRMEVVLLYKSVKNCHDHIVI